MNSAARPAQATKKKPRADMLDVGFLGVQSEADFDALLAQFMSEDSLGEVFDGTPQTPILIHG